MVADKITKGKNFDEIAFQWEHIDNLTKQFQKNIKPIIMIVNFSSSTNDSLAEALSFIINAFMKGISINNYSKNNIPTDFISDNMKKYFFSDGKFLSNRYIFQIYLQLRNKLESGDIFCYESIKYRSFENDLVTEYNEKMLYDLGLSKLTFPIKKHLSDLEIKLEQRILEVNKRIDSGDNKYFEIKKIGKNTKWILKYPSGTDSINHSFFNEINSVEICDILNFVNQQCNFTEAFDHILERYSNVEQTNNTSLYACLIAWGTNMSLGRMSEISDMSYSELLSKSDSLLRLETLDIANDIVCNSISELTIFGHYNIDGLLHSSSDGQKKELSVSTINSRHSPKYFGLNKGIVEYNLVINNIPVNAKIIGANEHESHFVYDILYNNTTNIKPEIHSTDTHGTNEVNFAILNFFDYQFAPRYRDIYKVVSENLYGFNHPSTYNGIIKPIRKINTNLIIEEWENIKRIIVSLALKTTTQSVIIRKLSSHQRKNKTKRALWEYDNIHKSLYLLNYIDIVQLRKNVQLALNRGESYHKLKKAVSYANFGKLRYKNEHEQQIWSAASRLLSNCIIHYNASILSKLLEKSKKNGDTKILNILKNISPVAWQHINFYGQYIFNKRTSIISIDEIIENLLNNHKL